MRFSTKILLLTLTITLGLSAVVLIAVRAQITRRESMRARQDIERAIDQFHERLNARQEQIRLLVQWELSNPQNKAAIDPLVGAASAEEREAAAQQLQYVFSAIVLGFTDQPQFHAFLDSKGEALIAKAEVDELQTALQASAKSWNVQDLLRSARPRQQYLWIDDKLFLTFGIPFRQTQDEDPKFAYFAGFEVTDEWVRPLMKQSDVAMAAWFIVNDKLTAKAEQSPTDSGIWQTMLAQVHGEENSEVTFEHNGEPYVGRFNSEPLGSDTKLIIAVASSLYDRLAPLRQLQRQIALVTFAAMLIAIAAARWIALRLSRPVEQLVAGTQRIAKGDFSQPIQVDRRDELGTLARSFNLMSDGLAQRDLIKDSLGQFVDPRIADALLTNPASLQGKRTVQSVLFSDLEKFTTLSEQLVPEQLVKLLNAYLGSCDDVVKELNGYLDKFSGDGVVAFWGPPVESHHALAACRAALRMVELTKQFRDPPLRVRVGIATGEVIVGIIGSEKSKKNYTALGDVVNLAARLEGANKVYGTQILIDEPTAMQVALSYHTRKIDTVRVVGRSEPVVLYELLDEPFGINASARIDPYDEALRLYVSGRWSEASRIFSAMQDGPARAMRVRCEQLSESPPTDSWDGIWNLQTK